MTQGHKSTHVRKKQIMDAARKLIMRSGSEHVTVRNMAKEVGISEAAIYRHFKSKTEILSFLADSVADGLLHDIDTAGSVGFTSLDIIDEILRTHLSRIEQRRGLSFLVLAEIISFGDKSLNKKVSDNIRIYVDRLKLLLSDGVRAGLISQDVDLEAAALLLFGLIQGLVNIWALSGYKFDLAEKYSELWKVYKRSLTLR
ncbi:MAG: TetR/AcrR family transcriptional regulator [Deltaproteobacteria bacterium]|nr:TetR/AcrR family transcriptional regulator [Deltaproteobacteria bacterium]